MPATGFSDPAFMRIAELAHMLAGLVFPPNRQPSAEAGMRRAMSALRVSSPSELLRVFEMPGESRDAVLAELTVGESYFFRDSAQLELLTKEILPRSLDTHGPARPLSIWSAGCASGEEPHTIAIMLREQAWRYPAQIVATDIAQPRLAAARRGRYTRWALRGVSDERITRWFSRSGTYYDVDRTIRDAVEFRALNLMVDTYPTGATAEGFDLVLCRNVLIYFDLPGVAHIAEGLLASLAPDGWLLLGASDPPLAHLVACESVMTAAGIAYRRADRKGKGVRGDPRFVGSFPSPSAPPDTAAPYTNSEIPFWWPDAEPSATPAVDERRPVDAGSLLAPATSAPAPIPRPEHEPNAAASPERAPASSPHDLEAAYRSADYPATESIALSMLGSAEGGARTWITYVRAVANQGRLHEAGELCARALELYPLDAELHYLHATLLVQAGWFVDASAAARRSIYLDRKLVMGHLLLGDALSRSGDAVAARIAFANVISLLSNVDPAAPIPAADGVPASRLRQIATLRMRGVEGALSP